MLTNLRDYFAIKHSGLFDEKYYLLHNPDVVRADVNPALHYLLHGGIEGRDPSPYFSSSGYLQAYPDVKNAGLNPLVHYLRYGRSEGRHIFGVERNPDSRKEVKSIGYNNKGIAHKIRRAISALRQHGILEFFLLLVKKIKMFCYWSVRKLFSRKKAENSINPEVSVVIPIYDRTEILIESIESILHQTHKDFELILVCDGSPDETLEIVRRYERQDERIRAFYFKNNSGNAVRGRNKAIKEARGKYLAFQDSDDVASPDRLAISVDYITKYNADVVYGGWRALLDGTRDKLDLVDKQEVFSPDCDLEMLKQVCVPCQSTVMARVDALRAVGGFNERMRYREDHELWLRLAYNGYTFKAIPHVLTNLRLHKNNLELSFKEKDSYWEQLMHNEYKKKQAMKPKIGYIVPGTGIGGGIMVICEHANRLIERGYDVSIITEDNSTEITWYPNLLANIIPLIDADNNFDILVATGWSTAYSVQSLPSRRKLYLVQSDERRFYPSEDPIVRRVEATYQMNFEFLTIAPWMQKWLKSEFKQNAILVLNGINHEVIREVEPIEPKSDKVRVLLEGPIDIPFKGMSDAFAAIENLDCEVWCVSSLGVPKPKWKCDRFLGRVPWNQMSSVYSSCDILLKMSRVESFSMPPLEMMACGGTAVIGEVTGIETYAINGYNALIVPKGDIEAAHNALNLLIQDSNLRKRLSQNGRETALKFRWEPTIDILEKILNS